jgi:UDP-2,4-diacetamido-2,4,6-trideoxy-beta-L-altropyranose hydrolase
MNILVRCDSSNIIGTGHVMRCLNYIEYNSENKYIFVCRSFNGNIINKIKEHGYNILLLDYTIEPKLNNYNSWLGVDEDTECDQLQNVIKMNNFSEIIIDHYGYSTHCFDQIKLNMIKITVIDDLCNRKIWCDRYINYNIEDITFVQNHMINPDTQILIGLENTILNKIFIEHIHHFKSLNKKCDMYTSKLICIMMGGTDPNNYTLKVIETLKDDFINRQQELLIIIGANYVFKDRLIEFLNINRLKYKLFRNVSYIELIDIYKQIDFCIGCFSVSFNERYVLGIPQKCLKIVENQLVDKNIFDRFNLSLPIEK